MSLGARTFASVRKHRNYRLYFGGQAVSFVGAWIQRVAAAWLVYELTDSAVAVGALAFAQMLPVTVLGLFVGTLIDRYEPRRVALVCESGALVVAATLAALTLGGAIEVWHVFLLSVFEGIAMAIGGPARHALVFEMVGERDLPNAVGLNSSLGTMSRVVGPALGGVIVAAAGAGVAFAVNAATFLTEILALLAIDAALLHPRVREPAATLVRGAREALRWVGSSPRAGVAFFGVLIVSTLAFNLNVLMPLLAGETLEGGPRTFGLVASAFGVGSLAGSLASARRSTNRLRHFLIGVFGYGAVALVLAPQDGLVPVVVLMGVLGFFYIQWGATALTALQLEAPEQLRGRAASLYFFAFMGGAPFGGLLAGWLVEAGGTELAFYVAGSVAVLTALVGWARLTTTSAARATSSSVISR